MVVSRGDHSGAALLVDSRRGVWVARALMVGSGTGWVSSVRSGIIRSSEVR